MSNPNSLSVPFLDMNSMHAPHADEFKEVFSSCLSTGRFIGGPMVSEFEEAFAEFCEASHCVGVSSGTDALRFALIAVGVKPTDVVITVPNTFIATTEAISQAGATIAFVDADQNTSCMDPQKLRAFLETQCTTDPATGVTIHAKTNRTVRAVIPVHLYGQPADMDPILEIAAQYSLKVIEDACQAHGAEYFSQKHEKWMKAGSMGDAAAFSFYPGKNLGAFGEGGAITTNDAGIAATCSKLRDHGQAKKYYHDIEGYNGRLDAVQAGVLKVKLQHLPQWNENRRAAAKQYDQLLADIPGVTPVKQAQNRRSVYHLYVILVENREELADYLKENDIHTGLHYPVPLHQQKAYQSMKVDGGELGVSEKLAEKLLSLPMFPTISGEQVEYVAGKIREFQERI